MPCPRIAGAAPTNADPAVASPPAIASPIPNAAAPAPIAGPTKGNAIAVRTEPVIINGVLYRFNIQPNPQSSRRLFIIYIYIYI